MGILFLLNTNVQPNCISRAYLIWFSFLNKLPISKYFHAYCITIIKIYWVGDNRESEEIITINIRFIFILYLKRIHTLRTKLCYSFIITVDW